MTKFKPLGARIIFKFVDSTANGKFGKTTQSGIVIQCDDLNQQTTARWGKVVSVGSDVADIVEDDYILIEPPKWTIGIPFNGEKVWQTDEEFVILVAKSLEGLV